MREEPLQTVLEALLHAKRDHSSARPRVGRKPGSGLFFLMSDQGNLEKSVFTAPLGYALLSPPARY